MIMDDKDDRTAIYQKLHSGQLESEEAINIQSAQKILQILFRHVKPESVLDVGCGLGTWLSVANALGAKNILGLDGPWLDKARLRIPSDKAVTLDLAKPFNLGRRFDLVICLEVAEHLESSAAHGFIESLTMHADVILFSAAIPLQGGDHHVNEQWPGYWCDLFKAQNYEPLDFIRAQIWNDRSIHIWLKQNILLFVKREILQSNDALASLRQPGNPLDLVHPDLFLSWMRIANKQLEEHRALLSLLSTGGTFTVTNQPGGGINISRGKKD
jgi:SAM-dependent methyltransferase